MEKIYDIRFENKCVGTVRVQKEGLYYKLHCSAKAPDSSKYRLIAKWDNQQHDFGLCIPEGDHIGMVTRIPIKKLTEDVIEFQLKESHTKMDLNFYTLCVHEPFPYLECVEQAYLEWHDGVMGLCFQNHPNC